MKAGNLADQMVASKADHSVALRDAAKAVRWDRLTVALRVHKMVDLLDLKMA